MWIKPNIEKLRHLNLTNVHLGDWILFCPKCDFQLPVNVAAKPECPDCYHVLHRVIIDNEFVDMFKC